MDRLAQVRLVFGASAQVRLVFGSSAQVRLVFGASAQVRLVFGASAQVRLAFRASAQVRLVFGASAQVRLVFFQPSSIHGWTSAFPVNVHWLCGAIFCHIDSGRVGSVWSAREKSIEIFSRELNPGHREDRQ